MTDKKKGNSIELLLGEAIGELKFGMPWEQDVFVTPLPEPGKPDYLAELGEDAKRHGADIANQRGATTRGSFFYPALLHPVNEKMRVYGEEQFGPIIPVVSFNSVFKEPVLNCSADFPFLWDEITVPIKYGSDQNMARHAKHSSRVITGNQSPLFPN